MIGEAVAALDTGIHQVGHLHDPFRLAADLLGIGDHRIDIGRRRFVFLLVRRAGVLRGQRLHEQHARQDYRWRERKGPQGNSSNV